MSVTRYRVTGDWRTLIGDTPADSDPYPDVVKPTGHVHFVPDSGPRLAGGTAYTIGASTALIADGQLRDLQGRVGVWLAADIDGQQVTWDATIHTFYRGVSRNFRQQFTLSADYHMTGEIQ